jgi:hypothetical protein
VWQGHQLVRMTLTSIFLFDFVSSERLFNALLLHVSDRKVNSVFTTSRRSSINLAPSDLTYKAGKFVI